MTAPRALRAFTPRDQKAIRAAAETLRINPELDVETAITELRVGEALVSTLLEDGAPSIVQRTLVKPPRPPGKWPRWAARKSAAANG